ncbi:MAG: hypothetical protein K1X64_03875 [Myxococcaceae bacterium]|nr:hypothetical protein [Myxococcaceae bacterium]
MIRVFHQLSKKISQFNRHPDTEFVGVGTLLASAAVGVVAFFQFNASAVASIVTIVVAYIVLFACYASRYTAWLPMMLGSFTMTAIPTAAGLGLGSHLLGTVGEWVGAGLGLLIGIAISVRSYWAMFRPRWRSEVT